MYRVLGADGKEYGPVTGEVLRQWITEGRANAQTKVKPEGGAEWQTLASVPEFEAAVCRVSRRATAAVRDPGGSPRPAAWRSPRWCWASWELCGITALVGLILGIVSLVKINRSGGRLSGQGLAIAGICVSGFMLFVQHPVHGRADAAGAGPGETEGAEQSTASTT